MNATPSVNTIESGKFQFEDFVLFTCNVGHILDNDDNQILTTCNQSALWETIPDYSACDGKCAVIINDGTM